MRAVCVLLCLAAPLLVRGQTLVEQADTAFREGRLEAAAALAGRAVAADPASVHAHLILGVIAARKNDWTASSRHFQQVIRLDPGNPHGYFYLGQAKLYQQQWQAAIGYFSQALGHDYPDRERLMIELALARNEAGQPQEALAALAKIAVPADQALAEQYYSVTAFARDKLHEPGQAIEAIRRALALDDTDPHHWEFLIGLLIRADRAPEALAEAIRAQRRFPDHAEIQYLFALASYHVTESPLSGLALRNLREADPENPRVLLAQGLLYRKQGKPEEATRAFQQAAQAGVRDAHLLLGIVYKENGEYDGAEREYREAERLNPQNGQVMLELGKLLLQRGELEEARLRLEKAVRLMPDASTVHYQLGLLYRRLGQTAKAQEHLRLAKQP